ncbi:MAG: hypothetical protein P8080_09090 [Gammaproteobacteria bacterium]
MSRRATRRSLAPSAAVLVLVGALLAGCAQTVRVESAWRSDPRPAEPFSRILVVGVSPDYNARCAFEAFMVNKIRSDATAAISSCRVLGQDAPLNRENIERAIAERKADAVLATSLVAMKSGAVEGGTSETRGDAYYKATGFGYLMGYYGAYGMPIYTGGTPVYTGTFETAPPITSVEGEAEVISQFYDTRDARLVYEINTRAVDLYSQASGLAEITGPIADQLRKDALIR